MTEQQETSNCGKEYVEVRNSLREIAQSNPVQARTQADALIQEMDPNGDILASLISPSGADTLSKKFRKLQETLSPESAAAVAFTACSRKSNGPGR